MIPLAISNIAWAPEERAAVFAFLHDVGVRGLEIAPGLVFADQNDPFLPSPEAVSAFAAQLGDSGLQPVSMQSLLFGVEGALLFGPPTARERFVTAVKRAIDLADRLGIPNLVLGSPSNRSIPADLDRAEAESIAIDVFRDLGDHCAQGETRLALEPNPPAYQTNFMNTVEEAADIARRAEHPRITVNFDFGAIAMYGASAMAGDMFRDVVDLVSHVHISEPQLAPAPADPVMFEQTARQILASGYHGWFSIEMRRPPSAGIATVRASVERAKAALHAAMAVA